MAELFMECEEEELAPWQKGNKDEEDDDEPIFVGEITSSKNTSYLSKSGGTSFNLAQRGGMQNGGLSRSMRVSFNSDTSSTVHSVNQQSITSTPSNSSTVVAHQPGSRTTPASQPMIISQGFVKDMGLPISSSQSSGGVIDNIKNSRYQSRPSVSTLSASAGQSTNVSTKRPAACEINNIGSKKSKMFEAISGHGPSTSSSSGCPTMVPSYCSTSKGSQSNIKNGVPVPRACPKCNIHFNVLDSLRHHMAFCCPDLVSSSCPVSEQSPNKVLEVEKGKLIMLVNDFYYGKDDGDMHLNQHDQKTNTTFKCYSCLKILKNNIRFMNHMKHHMELEKQSSESWENHTTCQHCHRQFPTPFQLQCHIETAHCPHESTNTVQPGTAEYFVNFIVYQHDPRGEGMPICKICELSYESEQVLLQHMKDNHKPGEMPYVCQVCGFRSSVYLDVDNHFRIVHENTKQLLCPFCLKVIKSGNAYVQHYMRHQKKGVYRCSKCKLQFLTCKEKVDHKTQHHRTFRKPAQLEGLPPGTKVTIRASMSAYPVGSSSMPSVNSSTSSTLQYSSSVTVNTKLCSSAINQVTTQGSSQPAPYFKEEKKKNTANKKITKPFNIDIQFFRSKYGVLKCVECDTEVKEFTNHFATYACCSLCRFRSSCNKSYVAHMTSFHTAPSKKKFWMFREYSNKLRDMKLVCVDCPFEANVIDSDKMAKHLDQNKYHVCRVISKSTASGVIDSMFQGNDQISILDETKKTEMKPSSVLPDTETLEIDLSADGNQKKTDQPLKYEFVEAVPSPNCDKLSDQQGKVNSKENTESSEITQQMADGLLSELTTEKECDADERVQSISSDQALASSNTDEAQDFKPVDGDIEIIQDDFEGIDTSDETKDCKTVTDSLRKCKPIGNEPMDEESCTQEKSDESNEERGKDPKEDVCFEQFFRSKDDPEAVASDVSEQGSIQLEPLTPSEVLEHEATEILQKGSVATATKRKGTTSSPEESSKETTPAAILISSEHQQENEKS
ncbi:zinc finger protein 280D-like isoform X2 [Narcine bancroftii]|uniref:zinc finger protein 280D-like isoform X2 n=1 Tax=Narcine bancroftii TaxID=1343680 RepID=UPI003831DE82